MKLLIVDDETIIRDGLKSIISRMDFPKFELYEADNGISALEAVEQICPDLILLDIRMPCMDGLEFMQHYVQMHYAGKIIVLSGYGEFEYTREALRCGAIDYLLKPIKRDTLCRTLEKAAQKISAAKTTIENQRQILQIYAQNEKIHRLIMGAGKNAKTLSDFLADQGLKFDGEFYRVVYAHIEIAKPECDLKACYFALCDVFSAGLCAELSENELFAISSETQFSVVALEQELIALAQKMSTLGVRAVFGISEKGKENALPVRMFYQHAQRACMERFCNSQNVCFFCERVSKTSIPPLLEKDYASIRYKIQQGDRSGLIRLAEQLFTQFTSEGYSVYSYLEYLANSLMEILRQESNDQLQARNFTMLSAFADMVTQCGSVDALVTFYADTLLELFLPSELENPDILQHKTINLARSFIAEHYSEDLTLGKIAEHVGMNPAYFSVLFKKINQCGLIDYINDVRIEHAVELLNNPQCMIYDVAFRVGFTSDKYFSRVFKKKMGVTPSEWRRKC